VADNLLFYGDEEVVWRDGKVANSWLQRGCYGSVQP